MTQHELVIEYIKEFGKILPAKMGGRIYKGIMFGSETSKRCRELRQGYIMKSGIKYPLRNRQGKPYPLLYSEDEGRFEVFTLTEKLTSNEVKPTVSSELPKPVQTPLQSKPVTLFDTPNTNYSSHYDN